MEEGLGAEGSFVAINNRVSQSVPHLHVHVVPRRRKDGLRGFFWPRQKYESDAQAAEVATRLRETVAALGLNAPFRQEGVADPAGESIARVDRAERGGMAVEQALQGFRETEAGESFSLQNPKLLKVELADVTIQAKPGRWSPTRARSSTSTPARAACPS